MIILIYYFFYPTIWTKSGQFERAINTPTNDIISCGRFNSESPQKIAPLNPCFLLNYDIQKGGYSTLS